MAAAVQDLDAYLDAVLADEGLTADQMVLFGFSQGTMMACMSRRAAKNRSPRIVGFSGRLLEPEHLADEVVSRPPVLLIHGDQDDVVPPESLPEAGQGAEVRAGFEVYAHVMKGTGHGIAPDGLSVALAFIRERLEH